MVKEVMNKKKEPECSVCMDDGKCLNSPSHKDYKKNNAEPFSSTETDYWDCVNYHEKKTDTVGHTMKNWVKNLQVKWKEKETYESDFVKWSKSFK